ncbi:GUN4 domain protein (plasmid) [Calothrix sp. NIES-4071]|nr:GUN4 domain protein [Calothrix sp. NIES-4071]BAZ64696.1 GUN4 domain protein [Calothrix sp. NIES-4105]
MLDNVNQPGEYDVVLGNKEVNTFGAVLGGIQGVKHRLTSEVVEHRIAALNEALKYEHEGLNFIIKALDDPDKLVRVHAYELLKKIEALEIKIILDEFRKKYYLIRFDGIYKCHQSNYYIHNIYNSYIRFYPDGTVIGVDSTSDAMQISKWFNKESNNSKLDIGTYKVENNTIEFSLSCPSNDIGIDYLGEINTDGNTIHLEWFHFAGNASYTVYETYFFFQLPSVEAPASSSLTFSQTLP